MVRRGNTHFSLTISEFALFEHLTEALAEFEVALVLRTIDELFELIRAGLILLRGLLLVRGLGLVWFLTEQAKDGIIHTSTVHTVTSEQGTNEKQLDAQQEQIFICKRAAFVSIFKNYIK